MPESGLGDDFLAPAFFLQASGRLFHIKNDALLSSSSVDENMGTAGQHGCGDGSCTLHVSVVPA
jgi:hypothetical protein